MIFKSLFDKFYSGPAAFTRCVDVKEFENSERAKGPIVIYAVPQTIILLPCIFRS